MFRNLQELSDLYKLENRFLLHTLNGFEQALSARLLSTAAALADALPTEERGNRSMRLSQAGCRSPLSRANAYTARVSLASLNALMQPDEHAYVTFLSLFSTVPFQFLSSLWPLFVSSATDYVNFLLKNGPLISACKHRQDNMYDKQQCIFVHRIYTVNL